MGSEKDNNKNNDDKDKIASDDFEDKKKKYRKKLEEISFDIEDLNPKYHFLVDIIGIENYKKLVYYSGGQYIYIPQYNKIIEKKKRAYVYNVFLETGADYRKTAVYCGLCVSTVRRYVKECKRALYEEKRKKLKN